MKKNRKCEYCNKIFENIEGRVFSNHVRWCPKNIKNGDKGSKSISQALKKKYELINGKVKKFKVTCHKCEEEFTVEEPEKKHPIKEKYFCTRSCANSKTWNKETRKKRSISMSKASKKLWKNEEYRKKMLQNKGKRKFTSQGEEEIRSYFIENYPDDKWTFGGKLVYKDESLIRDLYSDKLKICIEYDGIWHFKNINGQLKRKQFKDHLLNAWCLENGWKIIRVRDELYQDNKKEILGQLVEEVYNRNTNEHIVYLY